MRITEIQVSLIQSLYKQIKDLDLLKSIIITAITRGGEVIIPNGLTTIDPLDTLYVMGERNSVDTFAQAAGSKINRNRVKNVFITGGGRTALYLAQELEHLGVNVKIVEQDLSVAGFVGSISTLVHTVMGRIFPCSKRKKEKWMPLLPDRL